MRRILVTGGAGYIGSVLVDYLTSAENYRDMSNHVTVVDNFMWGQTSLNHLCNRPYFDIVKGDARDVRVMVPLLKKTDVFIPLAALVGAPLCERDVPAAETTNFNAITDALKVLVKDQRILYPNTNSGYGSVPVGECTEDTAFNPVSIYGSLKALAERAVLNRQNSVAFRLATVFGMSPRMRLDLLVNDFTYRAVTDGFVVLYEPHFMRNYIHVRDVARVFLHALMTKIEGGAYNVGLSTANLSKGELCKEIRKVVPEFEIIISRVGTDPDQRNYVVSNAKIEATGFMPHFSLQEGIIELVRGFRQFKRYQYGNV